MLWIFYSILSAFFEWIKNIFTKKIVSKYDEYLLSFITTTIIFIVLLPFVKLNIIQSLNNLFFISLFITWIINSITIILILKALKHTDLSLISPIFALSPVLLLITSPLIIWEFPSLIWLIWIIIILLWAYILNFKNKINFEPFINIIKNKWQRLILIVCILWSVSSNFYKIWMQNSSPLFFMFSLNLFISTIMLIISLKRNKKFKIKKTDILYILPIWLFSAMSSIFQRNAVNLNLIIYVLSIKRLSILFSVIWWIIFLKEKQSLQRIIATLVMLLWIFLLWFV